MIFRYFIHYEKSPLNREKLSYEIVILKFFILAILNFSDGIQNFAILLKTRNATEFTDRILIMKYQDAIPLQKRWDTCIIVYAASGFGSKYMWRYLHLK